MIELFLNYLILFEWLINGEEHGPRGWRDSGRADALKGRDSAGRNRPRER